MIPSPILLIHGFNGAPSNWTDPNDRFPDYLAAQGYDPDLIRVFNYGWMEYAGKRYYNNLGDLREIAHRLDEGNSNDPELQACAVDRLSRDSAARGGPEKVTLIAHSSGGLIARYYLSRQTEDQFGTRYRGNVARAIFLGTPHRGVDVEDILDPLPNRWVYGLMVRVHYLFPPEYHGPDQSLRNRLGHLRASARKEWYTDDISKESRRETPAFNQLHPGSEFMDEINRQGVMPGEVTYFNIFGNVSAGMRVQVGSRILLNKQKHFGDGLVTSKSAGTIPNAESEPWPIAEEYCLELKVGWRTRPVVEVTRSGEHPTPIHRNLRSHPGSRKRILRILAK
ncbi:MAG TPA: alpha/beta fold hydrolase [Anaerolineae bacterium]